MKAKKTYKKLKGIKPFNKFGFRSCYYHQLITAFSKFGVDDKIWLMNYLQIYKFDAEKPKIFVEELEILSEKEIENIAGLKLIKKKRSENIIDEIINSIDKGMPAIVAVDGYYLDYREDIYKKRHVGHFLLFYGYDKTTKKFIINEHMYLNSQTYVESKVDFKVIDKSFKNYLKRLTKPDSYGIIKIKRKCKPSAIDINKYKKTVSKNKTLISESLTSIKQFCDYLLNVSKDEVVLRKYIDAILEPLGILRCKKVINKHQLMFVYENDDINDTADKIVEAQIYIYGILARIKLANAYSEIIIENLRRKLEKYIMLEEKVHNFLLAESL